MLSPTPRLLWITFWVVLPAMTLAGVDPPSKPFVAIFLAAFIVFLAIDAQRLNKTLATARVSIVAPVSFYKDRLSSLPCDVEMPSRLREMQVALNLPHSFHAHQQFATASKTGSIIFEFTPHSRGEFLIQEAFIRAASGWELWTIRVTRALNLTVRVLPDLRKDPASRKLFAIFQQGQRVQRIVGRGREVERLRDYAAGDSFEEVYWKATARRGTPITKVFQVERTQDIYAIVDGSRVGNRNQAVERFVSASLLLALAAEKNADNFGLLTFSDRVQHFVRASHGKGHFHRCREAIFDLQPSLVSPDFAELFTFINLRIRKRSLLFFLTDLSNPLQAETFLKDASLIARRHIPVVNQIADAADRPLFSGTLPDSEKDVQLRLAGHLQWANLRELEKSLSRIGIRMQLLKPEQASAELIGQYMTIKQRQLL